MGKIYYWIVMLATFSVCIIGGMYINFQYQSTDRIRDSQHEILQKSIEDGSFNDINQYVETNLTGVELLSCISTVVSKGLSVKVTTKFSKDNVISEKSNIYTSLDTIASAGIKNTENWINGHALFAGDYVFDEAGVLVGLQFKQITDFVEAQYNGGISFDTSALAEYSNKLVGLNDVLQGHNTKLADLQFMFVNNYSKIYTDYGKIYSYLASIVMPSYVENLGNVNKLSAQDKIIYGFYFVGDSSQDRTINGIAVRNINLNNIMLTQTDTALPRVNSYGFAYNTNVTVTGSTYHVLLPLPFSDRKNNISTGKLVTRTLDGTQYIEVAGKNSVTNNFTRSDEALANLLTLTGAVSNDTSLQYWGIQYLEYVNTAVTLLNSVDLKKIDSTEYSNMQLAVTALKNSKTPLRKYYELLSGYYTELSNLHEYETLPTEISNLYSAVTSYRDTSNTFISDLKNDFNGDSGFIKQWNKYLDFLKQDNVDITNRNNMRFNTSYYFRAISCMQKLTDTRSIAGTIATADNDSADLIDTLISLVNEQIHRYETENS